MDYDDTNRGVLFQEQEKKSEKAPDYTGKLNVEGKEYRIAGWKKLSKNNKPFLSLSISEPQQSGYQKAKQVADELRGEVQTDEIDLNDIPF